MAIDSTGGRLSPENIKDVLLRAELYREIRAAQTKDLAVSYTHLTLPTILLV